MLFSMLHLNLYAHVLKYRYCNEFTRLPAWESIFLHVTLAILLFYFFYKVWKELSLKLSSVYIHFTNSLTVTCPTPNVDSNKSYCQSMNGLYVILTMPVCLAHIIHPSIIYCILPVHQGGVKAGASHSWLCERDWIQPEQASNLSQSKPRADNYLHSRSQLWAF